MKTCYVHFWSLFFWVRALKPIYIKASLAQGLVGFFIKHQRAFGPYSSLIGQETIPKISSQSDCQDQTRLPFFLL